LNAFLEMLIISALRDIEAFCLRLLPIRLLHY